MIRNNKCILGTMNIEYIYSSINNNINIDKNTEYKSIIDKYISSFKDPILDTAYYYGNTKTEQILGELLEGREDIKIATKVNPWYMNDFTNGKLGRLGAIYLENQFNTSLKNLRVNNVEILYLHCPDYETKIYETLDKCDELWRREKFNYLGISNYSKDQLIEIFDVCDNYELVKPRYYQGMYNIICRKVEEIFPIIEDRNMEFWAYNPLAGGLLTGKYRNVGMVHEPNLNKASRFKENKIYQNIFWKKSILDNLTNFWKLGDNNKCIELSYQWLIKYSKLRKQDKIVIGVSTSQQLENNMDLINRDIEYDKSTLQILDNINKNVYEDSPNYFY